MANKLGNEVNIYKVKDICHSFGNDWNNVPKKLKELYEKGCIIPMPNEIRIMLPNNEQIMDNIMVATTNEYIMIDKSGNINKCGINIFDRYEKEINVKKYKPDGFLGEIIHNFDNEELLRIENRMNAAIKISNVLNDRKLSQRDFAKMMNKSTTTISEWLSGDRNFTLDTLTDISRILNIKLLDL